MKKEYSLEYFSKLKWSLVVIKKDKIIYKSRMRRLKPLIFCIKKLGKDLRGAVVFDRTVGQASAILLKFAGINKVLAPTVSKAGKKFLEKNKIKLEYFEEVKFIAGRSNDEVCPMEKMSQELGEKAFIKRILDR